MEQCEIYANNNFTFKDLDAYDTTRAAICAYYIKSALDQGVYSCQRAKYFSEESKKSDDSSFLGDIAIGFQSRGTSASTEKLDAVIQNFINYVKNNPKDWEFNPDAGDWLYNDWPCKLD